MVITQFYSLLFRVGGNIRATKSPRSTGADWVVQRTFRSGGAYFGLLLRIHADLEARAVLVLELHDAVDERVDREIGSEADVAARMPLRSALTDDDVAGDDFLSAELLDATVLRIAVATVSGRAYALFMCHLKFLLTERDVADTDFSEALSVTLFLGVVLTSLHLEHDDLLVAAVLDDLSG